MLSPSYARENEPFYREGENAAIISSSLFHNHKEKISRTHKQNGAEINILIFFFLPSFDLYKFLEP